MQIKCHNRPSIHEPVIYDTSRVHVKFSSIIPYLPVAKTAPRSSPQDDYETSYCMPTSLF